VTPAGARLDAHLAQTIAFLKSTDPAKPRMVTVSTKLPLVIMVGADKGGVGKTTVSRALSDWLYARRAHARIFDSESPAGDLKRFVPAADVIDIAKVQDQMRVFDSLDGVTVLDVRAGLFSPTLRALDEAKLLADVRAGSLNLALLHVLGPTITSLNEVAAAAATIGGGVKHFLVKNHVNETEFFEWDGDSRFTAHFKAMDPMTIDVPHLDSRACEEVQNLGVSFDAFANDQSRSRILRGRVRTWLDTVWSQFGKVGLGTLIDGALG
jgi:hypothetical protein